MSQIMTWDWCFPLPQTAQKNKNKSRKNVQEIKIGKRFKISAIVTILDIMANLVFFSFFILNKNNLQIPKENIPNKTRTPNLP